MLRVGDCVEVVLFHPPMQGVGRAIVLGVWWNVHFDAVEAVLC